MSLKGQERVAKVLELAKFHTVKEISELLGIKTQTLYTILARQRSNVRFMALFKLPLHLPKFSKLKPIERFPIRDFDEALRAKALIETGIPRNVLAAKELFGESWNTETFGNLEARYKEYCSLMRNFSVNRIGLVEMVRQASDILDRQEELDAILAYQPAENFLRGLDTSQDLRVIFARANLTPKNIQEALHERQYWQRLLKFRLSYLEVYQCSDLIALRLDYLDDLLPTYPTEPVSKKATREIAAFLQFGWTPEEILLHLLKLNTFTPLECISAGFEETVVSGESL